jgi:hypothetical protein
MDTPELRSTLELALGFISLLSSGEELSSDDLQSIDEFVSETRGKLQAPEALKAQKFPASHWVFSVERRQLATFSVEAEDEGKAFARAAGYLHDNIEALRFTWDRRDYYSLTPLSCVRAPETP